MKIAESKVRVDMSKIKTAAAEAPAAAPSIKPVKIKPAMLESLPSFKEQDILPKMKKPSAFSADPMKDDYSALREAALSVQRLKAAAQQELEQIRRMRADALRYQQETATRARSEANQLILHARVSTQREIEELIRQASEEIQKMLADIRVIRITAQEELSAQRKFTDAAKLNSLSFSFKEHLKEQMEKPLIKPCGKEPCEKSVSKPRRQSVTTI